MAGDSFPSTDCIKSAQKLIFPLRSQSNSTHVLTKGWKWAGITIDSIIPMLWENPVKQFWDGK